MDRRQQKTQNAIILAFEELISKKHYDEITVQEIIDKANVGRTTFYSHFETKESVLDSLCEDLFSHIFDEELEEETTHDFSKSAHSENNMLTHILFHLKEDKSRYKKLFVGKSSEIFWQRFKILFKEKLKDEMHNGKWRANKNLPEDLFTELYISSFVETVKWWFKNSCKEVPSQIEKYFDDFCGTQSNSLF